MEKVVLKALATAYMQGVVDALNGEGGVEKCKIIAEALLKEIETDCGKKA